MAVVIAFLNCKLIKPKAIFTVTAAGFEPTSYEEPYNGNRPCCVSSSRTIAQHLTQFAAMSRNKLHVFVARFTVPLDPR